MMKRFVALSAGVALFALATVVPVLAQTTGSQSSDVNVDVNDYLTFAIANPAADCTAAAGGNCPFGSGAAATDLTSTGSNASAFAAAMTQLAATTNSADGYNVTAYASNAGSRTTTLLRSGGTGGTAADQITDSVGALETAQGANQALTTTTDTGLAFRLTDANTSSILRETEEDDQWGTSDNNAGVGAAQALWASPPLGSGAAETMYATGTFSSSTTTAYINWFVGVASTQQTGTYSGQVTFTASVN